MAADKIDFPDVGEMLTNYMKVHRIRETGLSRYIGKNHRFIYENKTKSSLQVKALWEICLGLEHNFFEEIARKLPVSYSVDGVADTSKDDEIIALKRKLEIAEAERDILVKAAAK